MSKLVAQAKRISKAVERALRVRATHWPNVAEEELWHRKRCDGYTSIPRTLPILMSIIDSQTKNQPAGRTYFGVWARAFDESVVIIENPMSLAFEAGFSGERAVTTWRQRMQALKTMGFIDACKGSWGNFHFVLLRNPHKVVWKLKSKIQPQLFMQLEDRAIEIGAKDMAAPADDEV